MRARFIFVVAMIGALLVAAGADATLPPPSLGRSVDIGLVSGTVARDAARSGHPFKLGTQDRSIPIGSVIDTTHGRVDLRAAAPPAPAVPHGAV